MVHEAAAVKRVHRHDYTYDVHMLSISDYTYHLPLYA